MSNITIEGYRQMQARTIALLLRYDEGRFRQLIDNRAGSGVQLAQLSTYRDLAVMFQLQNSLFEDIVPRIIRRLSFESPTTRELEELPARGRINWERTLQQSWNEFPGETPLQVHTRTRRRDFATPENLLTIITLLEYSQHAQYLLEQERIQIGDEALRHPLHTIIENCERTLNFPQFAALRSTAQKILDNGETEQLEAQLIERHHQESSAYSHLLEWRQQYRSLQLLEYGSAPDEDVVGADPKRDNYLYQLWLFYELLDMLQREQCIESFESNPLRLRFRWGAESSLYELRHDQERPVLWDNSPKVRPDYYIYRVDRTELRDGDRLIWHEPGYILDAKYYLPHDSDAMYSEARKRMLADLQLLGERHGALLFAYSHSEQTPDDAEQRPHQLGRLHAKTDTGFNLSQHIQIDGWQIPPHSAANGAAYLRTVLDRVHAQLATSIPIACHGVFLDQLSVNDQLLQHPEMKELLNGPSNDILICPKPHIGPNHIDIVNRSLHCCADARLCHIIHQPNASKPVKPPRNAEDLLQELQHIFSTTDPSELDDSTVAQIAAQVELMTRRFAEIAGAYRSIEVYFNRLRDLGMHHTLELLRATERESMALAIFLVEQLDSIKAKDFSAPVIHISSVLEIAIKNTIFTVPGLVSDMKEHKNQTLGKLSYMRWKADNFNGDWQRIVDYVKSHWEPHSDPDDPDNYLNFDHFVDELQKISSIRNKAAHTSIVTRDEYVQLLKTVCQSGKMRIGVLNALLLAWKP